MVGALIASVAPASSGDPSGPTILVVDDEPDIRMAVKDVLEATLDANVLVAGSAREGLDMLKESGVVELIMTDFKMPGMNGVEFLRQARRDYPRIPAVLITAFERELIETTDANKLARTVLSKPINPLPMVQLVRRLLAESHV